MSVAATTTEASLPPLRRERRFRVLRRLLQHPSFLIGAVLVVLIVLAAAAAPMLTRQDPTTMNLASRFAPPSLEFLLGTDQFGRDMLSRVLYGARQSLYIGAAVALWSGVIGAALGLVAAQFRALDALIMRIMDGLMAFPAILLAIAVSAALGPHLTSVVIALVSAYVPRTARVVRASALVVRELEFIESAKVSGAGSARIIIRHLLPNCLSPLLVQLSFIFAYAILAEAALSFLGIGPPPPNPSWGNIIADGRDYSVSAWWIMLFPGLVLSLAVLGTNLLGDGLRDVLDPRLKVEA